MAQKRERLRFLARRSGESLRDWVKRVSAKEPKLRFQMERLYKKFLKALHKSRLQAEGGGSKKE
ncbi:MAG TPA: hypothetical protein VD998_04305 [Verrucomicrobiae bacterium]|nr:hypothetical protein [Verrucomicrobiae bacterium]